MKDIPAPSGGNTILFGSTSQGYIYSPLCLVGRPLRAPPALCRTPWRTAATRHSINRHRVHTSAMSGSHVHSTPIPRDSPSRTMRITGRAPHLVQAAGLEAGGHEQDVGAGGDAVGHGRGEAHPAAALVPPPRLHLPAAMSC